MTYRELYENAIRLVAEAPTLGDTSDYEERASYILATFCSQCSTANERYRQATGIEGGSAVAAAYVELSDTFPLCDVFAPPATYYLAAMLTLDENEALSDKLFALYSDAVSAIQSGLPAQTERISDRYGMM